MTRNEMNMYRWADAEEMKPRKQASDADQAYTKLYQKLTEMLLGDDQL